MYLTIGAHRLLMHTIQEQLHIHTVHTTQYTQYIHTQYTQYIHTQYIPVLW